jgi:hypothetical protein
MSNGRRSFWLQRRPTGSISNISGRNKTVTAGPKTSQIFRHPRIIPCLLTQLLEHSDHAKPTIPHGSYQSLHFHATHISLIQLVQFQTILCKKDERHLPYYPGTFLPLPSGKLSQILDGADRTRRCENIITLLGSRQGARSITTQCDC